MTPGEVLFDDVSKTFRLKGRRVRHETLKGALFSRRTRRKAAAPVDFQALAGIDLGSLAEICATWTTAATRHLMRHRCATLGRHLFWS